MQDATVQSIQQTSPVPVGSSSKQLRDTSLHKPSSSAPAGLSSSPVPITRWQYLRWIPRVTYNQPLLSTPPNSNRKADKQGSNPWESAFNKVVNLLSAPVQSPFQAQQSQAPTSVYPSQLRTSSQQPGYATIGSADLVNQPGILAQLFPNLFDALLGSQQSGSKPVSERGRRGLRTI
jgi:hypothetical protein